MWFNQLMGFEEISRDYVHGNISLEGNRIKSKFNGKSFQAGKLEIPALEALRKRVDLKVFAGKLKLSQVVANVQELHCDLENEGALFQAASQFNLLEMIDPDISPEKGVDIYDRDRTQGPACAVACGAGTIYRNYFAPLNGQIGQTVYDQVDCLELIGEALGNEDHQLWEMKNGYALMSLEGILNINKQISQFDEQSREALKGKLKIGIQWDTEVTLEERGHLVSQAYCSALPVAYSLIESWYWASFARVILEATYEATLWAALANFEKTGNKTVFLTLVGGGAFGNRMEWILESLMIALKKFQDTNLDVRIVSYGKSDDAVAKLIDEFMNDSY
ncbi:hypothetical protein [Aureibacter tunicatorum]|uniref:Macro domain-containing protein n=1 Tax=Aureibacter tunicatorum TaxID=866807 RepID=A0AAE4BV54_9BACT|nr:hypothetical protein [Aureibacter tunicatorum]MDR6241438.1 hypothetical protein [Aureibacter tunicatorum]BDD06717.1 hypothetical protein AUTU_42000 [Aureibacter tunicatorum]